jgi:hypothetical protein
MKCIKIIIAFLCVLAFCSCNKDYDKLIEGEWELDKKASYVLKGGDTCYYSPYDSIAGNYSYRESFEDGNYRPFFVLTNEERQYGKSKKYNIVQDSIYFGTDSVPITRKSRIVKINKGKLIQEGYNNSNNFFHHEFNKVGFSWVSYIFTLIGLIWLGGYLIFRLGGLVLHYWRNRIYQYGEVYENTEDEEVATEELLAIKQALKPNVRDFIKSESGRDELSSMGDGIWQNIRESRTCYRKYSDHDLFIKKDEKNDDMSDENMYRLPNGCIPFDGGVIVLPHIYEFIISKGRRSKLRAWLRSEEGLEWQKSADGIVWVRDVIYNINSCKFTIWSGDDGNNCGSLWFNLRKRLKEDLIGFLIASIVWSIIYLLVDLLSGENYTFWEGFVYVLFCILFLMILFLMFFILDYLLVILIKFSALKEGEHFMKKSTIYYKDFAKKVTETNKKRKVYQREK